MKINAPMQVIGRDPEITLYITSALRRRGEREHARRQRLDTLAKISGLKLICKIARNSIDATRKTN